MSNLTESGEDLKPAHLRRFAQRARFIAGLALAIPFTAAAAFLVIALDSSPAQAQPTTVCTWNGS